MNSDTALAFIIGRQAMSNSVCGSKVQISGEGVVVGVWGVGVVVGGPFQWDYH